jgi:hypothetical protein
MKKTLISVALLASISAMAQETYTNAELLTEDLNGTARYVGMGGAMEALGADIATINTNPAGVGLFRRSMVNLTGGMISQQDAGDSNLGDATHASLDQLGFVWSTHFSRGKYLNIAISYKKNRNFNSLLNVSDALNGSSQNMNSYMNLMDARNSGQSEDWFNNYAVSQLDALYYKNFVGDKDGNLYYNVADAYVMSRANKGYIGEYSVNVSGNVTNRLYLGLTIGFCDVNFKSWTSYSESLLNGSNTPIGSVTISDQREITGTGFNVKAGAVLFPIEENPFRVGLYFSTPTWYDLSTNNYTYLINNAETGGTPIDAGYHSEGDYDYRIYSPWKFGISLGHTISDYIALGATYEYSDYSDISNRVIDGYDYYGQETTFKDLNMNAHTQRSLKGVSTLKLGAEIKASPEVAVRLGYNYVSPMYKTDAFKDGTINSYGTYYSSTTDYTNWKSTNRLTCGVGYSTKTFSVDLAYQYSAVNGNFQPFMNSSATYNWDNDGDGKVDEVENVVNNANPIKVSNKRHQLIATLTYRF